MDFLRNKEVRMQILISVLLVVVVCMVSAFYNRSQMLLVVMTGGLICGTTMVFTYRRYKKIAALSQDIDRILHGEESIRFEDYTEGELAVLSSEISKMTLRLLEQSE